jgi:hypothetical protein
MGLWMYGGESVDGSGEGDGGGGLDKGGGWEC